MRILHTADLHLGRQFNGISLDEDQAAVLDQIVRTLCASRADVLIIAGDVFDRASPPASAVAMFNDFLSRVTAESQAAVVMIAGNHDSGDRIAAMAVMADTRRALIRGAPGDAPDPLVLSDADGPVAFSALPFAYEYAACQHFGTEALKTPEDVLVAQIAEARGRVPDGARWIVVAHAFVSGAHISEGERSLTRVGGVEMVSPAVFDGAHYVALGHLHRPQTVGADHIRYSGAPLAFGFDEAGDAKSMTLVEIDGAGATTVEMIPFAPVREVCILRGRHADLMAGEPSGDFVKAVLTDDAPVIDAMARLRTLYPHACEMRYTRDERAPETKSIATPPTRSADPMEVIDDFIEHVCGERLSGPGREVIATALHDIRKREDTA